MAQRVDVSALMDLVTTAPLGNTMKRRKTTEVVF